MRENVEVHDPESLSLRMIPTIGVFDVLSVFEIVEFGVIVALCECVCVVDGEIGAVLLDVALPEPLGDGIDSGAVVERLMVPVTN